MKSITIYTDGACSGNPGPGGWGCVLLYREHRRELSGAQADTTNNRMELTAVIEGLRQLKEPCAVEVYSDSAYVCNAFLKYWVQGWQRNGWLTASKMPVENRDLWEELLLISKAHSVTYHKVKGHADNEMNNRCDALARAAIKGLTTGGTKQSAADTTK